MKTELREYPKRKPFFNGGYRYNPEICHELVLAHYGNMAEITALLDDRGPDARALTARIAMRARHARFAATFRRRLLRGK